MCQHTQYAIKFVRKSVMVETDRMDKLLREISILEVGRCMRCKTRLPLIALPCSMVDPSTPKHCPITMRARVGSVPGSGDGIRCGYHGMGMHDMCALRR